MATGRFKKLVIGSGLTGTDNGNDSITIAATSAAPSGPAGGVLAGTYPNPSFAADMATQAELDAHITDTTAAHAASAVSITDAGGLYTGTDVEAALQEVGGLVAPSAATQVWMPLTTVVGGVPELVWSGTDNLIPTLGPV